MVALQIDARGQIKYKNWKVTCQVERLIEYSHDYAECQQ